MPLDISRESYEKMSPAEKSLVISEGARIVDPDEAESAARREMIQAELRAERKRRTIKRSAFDKLTPAERSAHVQGGGLVED